MLTSWTMEARKTAEKYHVNFRPWLPDVRDHAPLLRNSLLRVCGCFWKEKWSQPPRTAWSAPPPRSSVPPCPDDPGQVQDHEQDRQRHDHGDRQHLAAPGHSAGDRGPGRWAAGGAVIGMDGQVGHRMLLVSLALRTTPVFRYRLSLPSQSVLTEVTVYPQVMPRIWSETIAAHRDAVREATLDATASLVAEHGLTGVTMSQIAQRSGIGRATLYKYFPDIESILAAWHERHIAGHLHRLAEAGDAAPPAGRLEAVLREYAALTRQQHGDGSDLAALLHQGEHVTRAHAHLHEFITALIRDAAGRGQARDDVPAAELAAYCLHALTAVSALPPAATGRLIQVTLDGLRPPAADSTAE